MTRRLLLVVPLLLGLLPGPTARADTARGPRIEVAFVLDVTGSMGPWIEQARARIGGIAADLAAGEPRPEVRFALVEFRDKGDAFVTRVHGFSAQLPEMQRRLAEARADGGGDLPEAVLEGLRDALTQLSWTEGADVSRLIYLVGDAPPSRHADTPTEEFIASEALRRGIVIHTIVVGPGNRDALRVFEALARGTEGRAAQLATTSRSEGGGASGRPTAGSLGTAVTATARAYSAAAGVRYQPGRLPAIPGVPLAIPPGPASGAGAPSGLLGAHLRVISDERALSDLLAAHESLGLEASPPRVDFSRSRLLALGGADAGLEVVRLERGDGVAIATLRSASPGVRFLLVPRDAGPVVAREVAP